MGELREDAGVDAGERVGVAVRRIRAGISDDRIVAGEDDAGRGVAAAARVDVLLNGILDERRRISRASARKRRRVDRDPAGLVERRRSVAAAIGGRGLRDRAGQVRMSERPTVGRHRAGERAHVDGPVASQADGRVAAVVGERVLGDAVGERSIGRRKIGALRGRAGKQRNAAVVDDLCAGVAADLGQAGAVGRSVLGDGVGHMRRCIGAGAARLGDRVDGDRARGVVRERDAGIAADGRRRGAGADHCLAGRGRILVDGVFVIGRRISHARRSGVGNRMNAEVAAVGQSDRGVASIMRFTMLRIASEMLA